MAELKSWLDIINKNLFEVQQVVFVARETQPLREEQLLADRRAVAEHEQVGVEKHPFVRTPQVGHDET